MRAVSIEDTKAGLQGLISRLKVDHEDKKTITRGAEGKIQIADDCFPRT